MTWIKICGTTNLDDALMAVEAGADALGFVFAESMRRVTPETVAEICRHVPDGVEKIGVFISETPERIKEIADQCGLTSVQLHQTVAIPGRGKVAVIPVLHMSDVETLDHNLTFPEPVERVLLDNGNAQKGGGTGKCFDWNRASDFLKTAGLDTRYRVIVAGGLSSDNVAEAIRVFRPFGVDVVSGVEREKGRKDPDKVRAFIANVRAADEQSVAAQKVQL